MCYLIILKVTLNALHFHHFMFSTFICSLPQVSFGRLS